MRYITLELNDTIELMKSNDFKDRFRAEYHQLKIRLEKLSGMIDKYNDGSLPFAPKCNIDILDAQYELMTAYLCVLKERAIIEDIKL